MDLSMTYVPQQTARGIAPLFHRFCMTTGIWDTVPESYGAYLHI